MAARAVSAARRTVWAIVVGAVLLRLLLFFVRGDFIWYDEGYYLLLSRSLRAGHGFMLNGLPHVALSPLQPLLVAVLGLTGLPDLWASRVLAAVCGALLVLPVAVLAERWFDQRGAVTSALFTAVFPALLAFLPFFPGERRNLYYGSEPLYLLLAMSAIAAGARAVDDGRWRWWLAAGALSALAFLARLEGIVLSAALGAVAVGALAARGRLSLWPRAVGALAVGGVVAVPYFLYMHGAMGRWAVSGRVQDAVTEGAPRTPPRLAKGSDMIRASLWGGDRQPFLRHLYALDASGTHMASQYWGIPRRAQAASPARVELEPVSQSPDAAPPETHAAPAPGYVPGVWSSLARATLTVVPVWLMIAALYGLWRAKPMADAVLWLAPTLVATAVPVLLTYAEPRVLLPLAPAVCILAAGACGQARAWLERRSGRARLGALVPAVIALVLAVPTLRAVTRAWAGRTLAQQVANGQRAVGEYLSRNLPPDGKIASWHPAVAVWAHREWRVLPYDDFGRIVGYAQAQGVGTIVFSVYDLPLLRDPMRAFTAVLVDSGVRVNGAQWSLNLVESMPLLFVGRLVGAAPSPPSPADAAPGAPQARDRHAPGLR